MSYSNRPSKYPDPTVSPLIRDRVSGKLVTRPPFTPSIHVETRRLQAERARKRNRRGHEFHG